MAVASAKAGLTTLFGIEKGGSLPPMVHIHTLAQRHTSTIANHVLANRQLHSANRAFVLCFS